MFKRVAVAGSAMLLLVLQLSLTWLPAQAYEGCKGQSSVSASASVATPGTTVKIRATIRDCDGHPQAGVTVKFVQTAGPAAAAGGAPVAASLGGYRLAAARTGGPPPASLRPAAMMVAAADCQVAFNPTSAVSDANGEVSSDATIPQCASGCQYTVGAATDTFTLTAVIRVPGCLPFTTAKPAATAPTPTPAWPLALAAAAFIAASLLLARRLRA